MASTLTVDNIVGATSSSNIHIPGTVVQTVLWTIPVQTRSTGGTWAVTTVPTIANTYSVDDYTFTKKFSNSKVVLSATGHVDHTNVNPGGASGSFSIVALFLDSPETLLGAGQRYMRYNNDESVVYSFNGEDTTTGLTKTYRLKCHTSADSMHFSRTASGSYSQNPFTIIIQEIAQ
jgi:hypothetical protein